MKCEKCNNDVTFKITNIRKNESLYHCDLCFWQFCGNMVKSYKGFKIAIKEIDEMIN